MSRGDQEDIQVVSWDLSRLKPEAEVNASIFSDTARRLWCGMWACVSTGIKPQRSGHYGGQLWFYQPISFPVLVAIAWG